MASVLVGSAHALFQLQYESLTKGVPVIEQQLGRLRQQVAKPFTVSVDGTHVTRGLKDAGTEADRALKRFSALERTFDRTRDSEIRAARASGDYGRALGLVDTALGRAEQGSIRYNNLLAQQATLERQAAAAAARNTRGSAGGGDGGTGGFLAFAGRAAGATGLAFGAQQAISAGIAAGGEALELRRTKSALGALTQDYQQYQQVLQVARYQQLLFGGSLQENIAGLSGLTITARQSGASLQTLIDLSQRLAILDPAQGAEGARIALSEALSGDPQSLAERYEIPRSALAKLRDMTIPVEERLKIIDQYLNKVGITSEVVGKQFDKDTISYNLFQRSVGDLANVLGDRLATAFSDAARGAAYAIALISSNLQAIFALSDALRDGKTWQEASAAAQKAYNDQMRDSLTITQPTIGGQQQLGQATAQTAEQTAAATQATRDAALASAASTIQQQILNGELERQKDAAQAAADRLYASGAGATEAGRASLAAAPGVDALTQAYLNLRIAQASGTKEGAGGGPDPTKLGGSGLPLGVAGKDNAPTNTAAIDAFNARQKAEAKALADAQRELALATATAAGRVAILRAELAKLRPGTSEYVRKQIELRQAQEAAASAAASAAKGYTKSADAQEKADLALLDSGARLLALRQKLVGLNPHSVEYKQTLKEIGDLEEKVADEQERQAKALVDARLAALDDRKDRRKDLREEAAARRVLASGTTSAEQKAAARDVLERIPLEQAKRALDIASKQRDAGGTGGATAAQIIAAASRPGVSTNPTAAAVLAASGRAAAGTSGAAAALGTQTVINLQVLLDGKDIAAELRGDVGASVIINLRNGLAAAQSAAPQKGV